VTDVMRKAESHIRISLAGRVAKRAGWPTPEHEAAHIVAARAERVRVYEASVAPDAVSYGRVHFAPAHERPLAERQWRHPRTRKPIPFASVDNDKAVRMLFIAWPDMSPTWREAGAHLRMRERQVAATFCRPENRHVLDAVAAELRERKTLDRDQIEHIATRAAAEYWREWGGGRFEQNTRRTYDERA
jgi:hypothetical protein